MSHLNVEIKARCADPEAIRQTLEKLGADFKGVDHQTDTYFRVPNGRLKLREGNIENSLIHYDRADVPGSKESVVTLHRTRPDSATLKEVLSRSLGVLIEVKKRRGIYFIDNVKFHVDDVEGLGSFVEIEAIDTTGTAGRDALRRQCEEFMEALGIEPADLVSGSYSDMLLGRDRVSDNR